MMQKTMLAAAQATDERLGVAPQ